MAQNTRKRQESTYEAEIAVKKYNGMNAQSSAFGWVSMGPDESLSLINWDLFSDENGDYLKGRRGSTYLKKAASPTKRGSTDVLNQITWDIGSEEYLITQEGTGMYSQALITTGDPTAIALAIGGAFALGSTSQADLFISGDKLYVLHPSGNYVIRWTGSAFVAYSMGLAYPWIATVTSATAGAISGSYTLGIEKVYQASGVDLMASTPNRRIPTSRIIAETGAISAKKIKFTIQATELDNDTLWTHLRVWRSKNKNVDITDPINPIDAQGLDDELYEEALITKAEIGAGALTSIATGSTLPLGNVGTQAGKPAGVYTVEVNNLDSVFFNLIGIDRIELLPIPACTTGCFNANRIFFSGVQDATLDDASKNNIWYSNYAGTKYAFQYNPLNFVDTGRDGQNMIKLMTFEKDVIGIKEAKTGRLPSGNVDIPYQTLDDKIGISHKNMAAFIPGLGIAALTNDFGDFRVFGYDLRWNGNINGRDLSQPIRTYTETISGATVSFAYIHGKLIIRYGTGVFMLVLHVKEGKGWTLYQTGVGTATQRIFTFAQGTRLALVSKETHLVEFEKSTTDGDVTTADDAQASTMSCYETTHPFKSKNPSDIIQHDYLSINAKIPVSSDPMAAGLYVNTINWPDMVSVAYTNFTPDPGDTAYAGLADREYRLYIAPQTIGTIKWCPPIGNNIAYIIRCNTPCIMRGKTLHCTIDQNGSGYGAFDPFNMFPTTNTDPTWAQ